MDRRAIALILIGVGWRLALPIVLGAVGGVWLDGRLGSKPWFALVGLGLGTLVGYYGVYRLLLPIIREATGKKEKA